MLVKFKRLNKDAIIPEYKTSGAAGFDFHSAVNMRIASLKGDLVQTGLSVELPRDTFMTIVPRSGLSLEFRNYIGNGFPVVDEDYRGEIFIYIVNNSFNKDIVIKKGDRIAQGIVLPYIRCEIIEVNELLPTTRGQGGWGSTGIGEENNESIL